MTRKQAEAAIRGILAALPDRELPKGRKEVRDGKTTLWFGGKGHNLGTATSNGERDPRVHLSHGLLDVFEAEATYRADAKFLAAGDKS